MSNKFLTYLFIVAVIIIGVYLTVKATNENSWDGWGIGSTQTMLNIKYWVTDGWAKHYFLHIPAGYSKTAVYFDNPELRQHAWVDVTGNPNQKRIYYTHFPPGYLFPLAFLMELGVKNRFWFRLFQILISLTSLLLLYKFLNLIANPTIAFASSLFYAFSVPFLNFADSLANLPIDDLLRIAILALSILAIKQSKKENVIPARFAIAAARRAEAGIHDAGSRVKHGMTPKFYLGVIWFLYLILSFSSYDSTFFVFIWLVGLNIVTRWHLLKKGAEPRIKWLKTILVQGLFFASAPILAFGLQIIQNSWYLGFSGMISDFLSAFNKIGLSAGEGQGFIQTHFLQGILFPITEAFAFPFRARYLIIFIIAIIALLFVIQKNKKINELIPFLKNYLFLLGVAAFSQTFIILDNHPYKGRVLGLFASLLIGIFIFLIIQLRQTKIKLTLKFFIYPLIILLTIFMLFLQTKRTIAYIEQWPNNIYDQKRIEFAKELKRAILPFNLQDVVIFSMLPPQSYNNGSITSIMATYYDMYYQDAPILYFNDTESMDRDFTYLKRISKYPFSALIILEDKNQVDNLFKSMKKTLLLVQDKYILLISP